MTPVFQPLATATLLLTASLIGGDLNAEDIDAASEISSITTQKGPDGAVTAISWSDLAPENGKPFNDPFAKLSNDQIADLGFVFRVRRLIADEKIATNGEDAKEAAKLAKRLEQQGIDINWLMMQRERVQQLRALQVKSQSNSIAKSLRDQRVSLTGFTIPVKVEQGRLSKFFLIPTYAACSHEDAPPRLQVIFVSTSQGIERPDRRTPVRVTGQVAAKETSQMTINASGPTMVHAAYEMSFPTIEVLPALNETDHVSKN